jgi:hypothetical protein
LDDVSIDAVLRIVGPAVSLQVKVMFTLLPAMKAQRRIRSTALPFLQPQLWMGGGWSTPRAGPLYNGYPLCFSRAGTHSTEGWMGSRAGLDRCGKSAPLPRIQSLDRLARRQSLYRLSYLQALQFQNMGVCLRFSGVVGISHYGPSE